MEPVILKYTDEQQRIQTAIRTNEYKKGYEWFSFEVEFGIQNNSINPFPFYSFGFRK